MYQFCSAWSVVCSKDGLQWNSEFLEYFSDADSFVGAEAECQKLGGHLVSIVDKLTNDAVAYLINDYTEEDPPADIWIGGHLVSEAEWKWTDKKVVFNYTNWNETSESELKCMNFSMPSKFWDADDCDKEKPFICKLPSNNNTHRLALAKKRMIKK
uniref:C-type lectin domain-containing protein n=1 Tax=Panagrolaimus sp. ES5 TaxID=591445 RepID=A0AC34G2B0_9BILA